MQPLIYLTDDEANIRELIASFLVREGFSIRAFPDGESLLLACQEQLPDLLILDLMLPGIDGLSVLSQLRQKSDLPIIIVSARDTALDRVTGLTLGSDDYLVKPFLPLELVARVRALLRRIERSRTPRTEDNPQTAGEAGRLSFGSLRLDAAMHTVTLAGEPLLLTPTEFEFLHYLLQHQDRAVGREELLRALWQFEFQVDTRAADDLVKRLRKKLREKGSDVSIQTVWGFGFRLSQGEVV